MHHLKPSSLICVLAIVVMAGAISRTAEAKETIIDTIQGRASVIDGDTLEIHGQRIRLFGIDALEGKQQCTRNNTQWRCGQAAANALDQWIASKTVTCKVNGTDRYQRQIARCYVGNQDMQAWLVGQGWALAYRRYSTDYVSLENQARNARRGVWDSQFVPPWDWRKSKNAKGTL